MRVSLRTGAVETARRLRRYLFVSAALLRADLVGGAHWRDTCGPESHAEVLGVLSFTVAGYS